MGAATVSLDEMFFDHSSPNKKVYDESSISMREQARAVALALSAACAFTLFVSAVGSPPGFASKPCGTVEGTVLTAVSLPDDTAACKRAPSDLTASPLPPPPRVSKLGPTAAPADFALDMVSPPTSSLSSCSAAAAPFDADARSVIAQLWLTNQV